jgi:hypothetical protein
MPVTTGSASRATATCRSGRPPTIPSSRAPRHGRTTGSSVITLTWRTSSVDRRSAAYFGDGRDLRIPDALADLAAPLGIAPQHLLDGIVTPEIKELAKAASDEALAKNVFGSPFLIVDDEPFRGWDRLPMLEEWITRGGW